MKKAIISLAFVLVLVPALSLGATQKDLEKQQEQLMQQLIVILKAKIQELTAKKTTVNPTQVVSSSVTTPKVTDTTPAKVIKKKKRSGGGGGGSSSRPIIPVPDTTAPTTPTNLIVTQTASSSVTLSWASSTDNVGIAGYSIYKNGVPAGSSTRAEFKVSGLLPNSLYFFSVTAYDGSRNISKESTEISTTTATFGNPPTMTLELSPAVIAPNDSTTVTWTSQGANYCTESGKNHTQGSIEFGPLAETKVFTMTCIGSGGSVTKSVTVTVEEIQGELFTVSNSKKVSIEQGGEHIPFAHVDYLPQEEDVYLNTIQIQVVSNAQNNDAKPWNTFNKAGVWLGDDYMGSVYLGDLGIWKKQENELGQNVYIATVFDWNLRIPAHKEFNLNATVSLNENAPVGEVWTVSIPSKGVDVWTETHGHRLFGPIPNIAEITVVPADTTEPLHVNYRELYTGRLGDLIKFEVALDITALKDTFISADADVLFGIFKDNEVYNAWIVERTLNSTGSAINDSYGRTFYKIAQGETETLTATAIFSPKASGEYKLKIDGVEYRTAPNRIFVSSMYLGKHVSGPVTWKQDAEAPTMTLTANPTTVAPGERSVITWTSTNANYCATGDKGSEAGTSTTDELYATETFTLTCFGFGGSVTQSVTVVVDPALTQGSSTTTVPIVSITSTKSRFRNSMDQGDISYSIKNAPSGASIEIGIKNAADRIEIPLVSRYKLDGTTRTIDLGSPAQETFPSNGHLTWSIGFAEQLLPIEGPLEIRLYNSNNMLIGKATSTFVIESSVMTPVLTLTVVPSTINAGQSTTLSWSSEGTNVCRYSQNGDGMHDLPVQGSIDVSPSQTSVYTVTCGTQNYDHAGGYSITNEVSQSVTIAVNNVTDLTLLEHCVEIGIPNDSICTKADFNADGVVDFFDVSLFETVMKFDLSGDSVVDGRGKWTIDNTEISGDLAIFMRCHLKSISDNPSCVTSDFNNNGKVNSNDYRIFTLAILKYDVNDDQLIEFTKER